mmetsp:Transcript_18686/g.46688  ORF Transcript_18686/g.46688 Transcript_18686/m.46688 type:complete len:346 (-) Transcript_18686:145-1182(-)
MFENAELNRGSSAQNRDSYGPFRSSFAEEDVELLWPPARELLVPVAPPEPAAPPFLLPPLPAISSSFQLHDLAWLGPRCDFSSSAKSWLNFSYGSAMLLDEVEAALPFDDEEPPPGAVLDRAGCFPSTSLLLSPDSRSLYGLLLLALVPPEAEAALLRPLRPKGSMSPPEELRRPPEERSFDVSSGASAACFFLPRPIRFPILTKSEGSAHATDVEAVANLYSQKRPPPRGCSCTKNYIRSGWRPIMSGSPAARASIPWSSTSLTLPSRLRFLLPQQQLGVAQHCGVRAGCSPSLRKPRVTRAQLELFLPWISANQTPVRVAAAVAATPRGQSRACSWMQRKEDR